MSILISEDRKRNEMNEKFAGSQLARYPDRIQYPPDRQTDRQQPPWLVPAVHWGERRFKYTASSAWYVRLLSVSIPFVSDPLDDFSVRGNLCLVRP